MVDKKLKRNQLSDIMELVKIGDHRNRLIKLDRKLLFYI
jgi:hypothetical protein